MSALPPKADMCSARGDVRYGPKADSCSAAKRSLFDHLVGGGQKLRMKYEAQSFGGLKIDHELEFCGPHDWQVGWFLTPENPPGIDAGEAIAIGKARSVAH